LARNKFEKIALLPTEKSQGIIGIMDLLKQLGQVNQNFLWANCIWSAVASGYIVYGWKQRSLIPFLGGFVMMIVAWLTPALTMSLVSIVIMFIVWWLCKQGY
jgi:hypothetical protein